MQVDVLFWVFIGIFSITAIITLLGITGVLKNIKEGYLNVMFTSLILEVVAAVLVLFNGTDVLQQSNNNDIGFSQIIEQAGFKEQVEGKAAEIFIINKLKSQQRLQKGNVAIDSLSILLEKANANLSNCQQEMKQLNKSFYTKISRLKRLLNDYDGFINIAFRAKEKKEVYIVLKDIFEALQKVEDENELMLIDGTPNNIAVKNMYVHFKQSYIALTEDKRKEYTYIFQSDILQMLQGYLNIIKE